MKPGNLRDKLLKRLSAAFGKGAKSCGKYRKMRIMSIIVRTQKSQRPRWRALFIFWNNTYYKIMEVKK